jgi:hypothetical protein
MTRRMPNARCTGPAPWKPLTSLSGTDHLAHRVRHQARTEARHHRDSLAGCPLLNESLWLLTDDDDR